MGDSVARRRIFTVEQANELLPRVRTILQELRARRTTLQALESAVAVTELEGLDSAGVPSSTAQTKASHQVKEFQHAVGLFQQALDQLDALGCQLKDLDQGLIDFFTVHQGQLVYLCWKDGESAVRFWHGLEDGFTGRRPISELANN